MDLKSRLESHTVSNLKKEISNTNIKGYSKLPKADVIKKMLQHKEKFQHIKHAREGKDKKKQFLIKQKKKDGKVVSATKKEIHPEGIHIHINWKDGESQTKTYNNKKLGESAFKKFRAERKEKRDYKNMKLMDGENILDFSA